MNHEITNADIDWFRDFVTWQKATTYRELGEQFLKLANAVKELQENKK